MGYWGVKSYEGDNAADALDAAFERVHGATYEALMDDRNPLSFDQVQGQLADASTLHAAVEALKASFGPDLDAWDGEARLAFAGVVVRHAEAGVAIPDDLRDRARGWLEREEIEWEDATRRRLRKQREIQLLGSSQETRRA